MQVLLNELSLTGQFESIDHFIEHGIVKMLQIFSELQDDDEILKKQNLYTNQVTPTLTIHKVLTDKQYRTYDELRKFKIHISRILSSPYWDENQQHNANTGYLVGQVSVINTCLAEACERNSAIISFNHEGYQDATVTVHKSGIAVNIDNIYEEGQYTKLLYARGLLVVFSLKNRAFFRRTNMVRHGQAVYKEISTGNYWYLDNLHKNHFEVFNDNEDHLGIADLKGTLDTSEKVKGRIL